MSGEGETGIVERAAVDLAARFFDRAAVLKEWRAHRGPAAAAAALLAAFADILTTLGPIRCLQIALPRIDLSQEAVCQREITLEERIVRRAGRQALDDGVTRLDGIERVRKSPLLHANDANPVV